MTPGHFEGSSGRSVNADRRAFVWTPHQRIAGWYDGRRTELDLLVGVQEG
jgi:hypothetical protein